MNLKSTIFLATMTVSLWSSATFASHAYRSMDCSSTTHTLNYNGNYPVGGDYGIAKIGSAEVKALPLLAEGDPDGGKNTLKDADVIYTEVSSEQVGKEVATTDCGYDYTNWKSKKTFSINLLTDDAAKITGLKEGSILEVTCTESTSYPNGCQD